jgi:hypothetical protein
MCWAQCLKRVFGIDIDLCTRCGGKLRVIASIEEPEVIAKILAHLERMTAQQRAGDSGGMGGRDARRSARKPGIRPAGTVPAGRATPSSFAPMCWGPLGRRDSRRSTSLTTASDFRHFMR